MPKLIDPARTAWWLAAGTRELVHTRSIQDHFQLPKILSHARTCPKEE